MYDETKTNLDTGPKLLYLLIRAKSEKKKELQKKEKFVYIIVNKQARSSNICIVFFYIAPKDIGHARNMLIFHNKII